MSKLAVVVTTIQSPTKAITNVAELLGKTFDFVIIGDRKSPADFFVKDTSYYSIEKQSKMDYAIMKMLPDNHYARKNLGYLVAIENGAEAILETDDDNSPLQDFGRNLSLEVQGELVTASGWFNVYRNFTDEVIWPRGFPLEQINHEIKAKRADVVRKCPIQQYLADGNPDVDAVYRLTHPFKKIRFGQRRPVILDHKTLCPYNSQNTATFLEAFPLLYLPSFVSFRMTDIWRSLVGQIILWSKGWHVSFHSPTVEQDRNEHNLIKDFELEIPGYLNNQRIVDILSAISLSGSMGNRLFQAYDSLRQEGLVPEKEMPLVESWLKDLERAA